MLKQTTVFDVSLHISAIFMLNLLSALSKITTRFFTNDCRLLLSRTLPVSLSLSLSNVLRLVGVVFGPILDIWNSCIFLGTAIIGTLGRRAESIVGCEQVSFMLVMWYQRARSHVLWLLWTRQAQIWKSLDISCRQADSRLVTMSHFFVTAFSVVACCVLLSTCSFLSRPLFLWLREGIFDSVTCAH